MSQSWQRSITRTDAASLLAGIKNKNTHPSTHDNAKRKGHKKQILDGHCAGPATVKQGIWMASALLAVYYAEGVKPDIGNRFINLLNNRSFCWLEGCFECLSFLLNRVER